MKKIDIVCIIDKSGSMSSIANEAINGFNTFLKDQQNVVDYKVKMSVCLFDTKFYKLYDNLNVNKIEPMNDNVYRTGGCTALLDCLGMEMENYLDSLATKPKEKRSNKTLFIIITDGAENSSKFYHKSLIKNMIEEFREDLGIEFIFLAANQNAFLEAENIGISRSNAYNFDATAEGITIAYNSMSSATKVYATTNSTENLFSEVKK